MDLKDTDLIFYPTAVKYTFFSAAHGTSFKIDYTLGHKASFN
jgi:hypothetical protein